MLRMAGPPYRQDALATFGKGAPRRSNVMIIDENAYGILVSYFDIEDEEYGLEREEFVRRYELWRDTVRECLKRTSLGPSARAIDFGHALYVELPEDDAGANPLKWARHAREMLSERAFDSVAVVTHGSRWVDENAESFVSTEHIGDCGVVTLSNPSEPLRRALYAEAATHPEEIDSAAGSEPAVAWGPGLYLDTEAAEALSMAPKNAPTVLYTRGAGFYRVGK